MAQRKGYLGLLFVLFLNLFLIQSESRSLHHIKRQFPHIPKTNRKLQINKKLSSLNRYYSTFATAIEPPGISTSNDSPFCVNTPLTPLNPSTPTPLTPAPTIPTPSIPIIPTPTTPPSSTPIFPSPSIPIIPTPIVPSPSTPTPTIPTPLTPTPITPAPTTPFQPSYSPPPKITNSPPKGTSSPPTFRPGPPIFLPPIIYPPPLAPPSPKAKQNLWCVAKPAVPDPIIQEAMDYACGSGAECDQIKSSGSCFEPDTVISHASYAFNSYFQDLKETGATCDFGGAAVLVKEDPSYNGCHFKLA